MSVVGDCGGIRVEANGGKRAAVAAGVVAEHASVSGADNWSHSQHKEYYESSTLPV